MMNWNVRRNNWSCLVDIPAEYHAGMEKHMISSKYRSMRIIRSPADAKILLNNSIGGLYHCEKGINPMSISPINIVDDINYADESGYNICLEGADYYDIKYAPIQGYTPKRVKSGILKFKNTSVGDFTVKTPVHYYNLLIDEDFELYKIMPYEKVCKLMDDKLDMHISIFNRVTLEVIRSMRYHDYDIHKYEEEKGNLLFGIDICHFLLIKGS
jgi:hypothetical protein